MLGTHNHRLWNMGPRFRGDDSIALTEMVSASPLLVEQGNALVIRPLRDRLQIGVDIREIVVRQDRLRERRHGAVGAAYESRECLNRNGIRRELGAGDATLGLHAVTLPAAVLDVSRLALLGRGSDRIATAHEAA